MLYSEFKNSNYLSIVDYDFIDNEVRGIVSSFEQENEVGLAVESLDANNSISDFITKIENAGLDPLDFIDTYAEAIKFNGNEEDLTFDNRQKQGTMQVKMQIELIPLAKKIIFEETIFEALGDIKQYLDHTDNYNINNNDNVINAFDDFVLEANDFKALIDVVKEELLSKSVDNENTSPHELEM